MLDILSRDAIIEDLKDIIDVMSTTKKGIVFALDGKWGYGKSFVLDILEQQLSVVQSEESSSNKYNVFHYNCWQYDYYEEPAIAIVSSMLEKYRDANKYLLTIKNEANNAMCIIKEIAEKIVENKVGINLVDVYDKVSGSKKDDKEDAFKFDTMYSFKETLDDIRKKIATIAEDETIVFVVDELDRCMPAYAIKVLERLHHIFDGVKNVIVLLAIDSTQLEGAIKEIFGENCDVDSYLRKFISFKYKLDIGNVQRSVLEKYNEYFDRFILNEDDKKNITDLICNSDVDMRNLDKLFEKILIIHNLVEKVGNKCDSSIVFFELVWMIYIYKKSLHNNSLNEKVMWKYIFESNSSVVKNYCDESFHKFVSYLIEKNPEVGDADMISGVEYRDEVKYEQIISNTSWRVCWFYFDYIFADGKTYSVEDKDEISERLQFCKKINLLGINIL